MATQFSMWVTVNKSKYCFPTILADAHHLPIRPKSFDVVVALQIFQQIPSDTRQTLVDEMRRVARQKIVLHSYQKQFYYKDGYHSPQPFGDASCPHDDLRKIMPDATWTKLNFPYMLTVENEVR